MTLQEAAFDDIMEELATRYTQVVLIGHRDKFEDDHELQRYRYTGNPNILLGLLCTVQHDIIEDKNAATEDVDNPV